MRNNRAAFLLLALFIAGPSYGMPFNILQDDPAAWGCPNLLITISTRHHGAELFIPDTHVAEAAQVPWQNHLESEVHVRMGSTEHISPPIPIYVDRLKTFRICPALDRERVLSGAITDLRAQAKARGKPLMRVIALATTSARRGRFLMLEAVDLADPAAALRLIRLQVRSLFTEGVGLTLGESVNVFLLSADAMDGLPPRSDEIDTADNIFRFALPCIDGDPDRFPGRHLLTLIKASSVAEVPDLLFIYDPWENSRNFVRRYAP